MSPFVHSPSECDCAAVTTAVSTFLFDEHLVLYRRSAHVLRIVARCHIDRVDVWLGYTLHRTQGDYYSWSFRNSRPLCQFVSRRLPAQMSCYHSNWPRPRHILNGGSTAEASLQTWARAGHCPSPQFLISAGASRNFSVAAFSRTMQRSVRRKNEERTLTVH